MNTTTHLHGTLTFADDIEVFEVKKALMRKGLIRDLGNGLVFVDTHGKQVSPSYDMPVIDGLELTIPFGEYELLSSELIALANKFKPVGDLISFSTTGNIHLECYKKTAVNESGFMFFKAVTGANNIFDLVKLSLDSEDIDLYEGALKSDMETWNAKFGWAGNYDQVRFEVIEMASTILSSKEV